MIQAFPNEGINDLRFGMSRDEVIKLVSEEPESYQKVPWAKTKADAFDNSGFHCHYDDESKLEGIEVLPEQKLELLGIKTWKYSFKGILDQFRRLGLSIDVEPDGTHIINEIGAAFGKEKRKVDSWYFYSGSYQEMVKLENEKAEKHFGIHVS